MTTTSSTTATPSAASQIVKTLGSGSGVDTTAIVDALIQAQFAGKLSALSTKTDATTAQISEVAKLQSGITGFASALTSLIRGGTLFSQPSVSNTAIFTASALPGSRLGGLSASITVEQLAQAQTLSSAPLAARTDPVGEGTLTLTVGSNSYNVTIDATNNSLDGLAKAINDQASGVKASVVTDANGARLVLKGATGAANAFTLSVPGGTTSGLERFASASMTVAQSAQDEADAAKMARNLK